MKSYLDSFTSLRWNRYVEPFLGSGAAFFALNPKRALLNDANQELVDTYKAIKHDWVSVVDKLYEHDEQHSEDHYYKMRALTPRSASSKAARFIYLNRTCFNGLYRVNKKGRFNVPLGTKTSAILDTDNFSEISRRLAKAELLSGDFEAVIATCGAGDLIYADPPYTVKHNTNGFLKYNEKLFSWADQERLRLGLIDAKSRGAAVIISNADHPSLRELYDGATHLTANRHSIMASESARRKMTTELLILL